MPIVDLQGVRLNYISVGPNELTEHGCPPLVLLHGLAGSHAYWYLRMAPALAQSRQVIMVDLRGHGRSSTPPTGYSAEVMAADVRCLVDHLEIERAHVLGHSFGGNVGLHFACRNPDRTATLTLADVRVRALQPHVDLRHWVGWSRYRDYLDKVGIPFDESADDVSFVLLERAARLRVEQPNRMKDLQGLLPSPFAGAGGETAARRWLELLATTTACHDILHGEGLVEDDLRALAVPTLLLYGEYSHVLPTACALRDVVARARMEIVPGAGHFFPTKYPERLVDAVTVFLEEDEASRAPAERAPMQADVQAGL
jgi:pimeloyl-ACP methyl ester carboxylesterase